MAKDFPPEKKNAVSEKYATWVGADLPRLVTDFARGSQSRVAQRDQPDGRIAHCRKLLFG